MDYTPIPEGGAGEFFANVGSKVIPALIKKGVLKGMTIKGRPHVRVDEAFQRVMRYGIERFVYGLQGFSFFTVRAPLGDVAAALAADPLTRRHVKGLPVLPSAEGAAVNSRRDRRDAFLFKPRCSEWPVVVQTAHWIESSDPLLATLLAARLSRTLRTRAVSAWDDDFAGSTAIVCDEGRRTRSLVDEEDWAAFYLFFYEQGICVPNCFIRSEGGEPRLLADEPGEIERADLFVLSVPTESRAKGPHVFHKIRMMAEAVEEDLEDESAFRGRMNDSLWQRVESLLKL